MEFITEGVWLTRWGWLGLSPSSHPAVVARARGAEWKPQNSLISHAKQTLAVFLTKIPAPSAWSTPQSSLLVGAPEGAGVPLTPNVPSSKALQGDPSQEEDGEHAGHVGALFGMRISKLPEAMVVSPLPTGHAGKYLCPDFAGQREGISFLRPPAAQLPGINPFSSPWDGGRGMRCPPSTLRVPHWSGKLG